MNGGVPVRWRSNVWRVRLPPTRCEHPLPRSRPGDARPVDVDQTLTVLGDAMKLLVVEHDRSMAGALHPALIQPRAQGRSP